MLDFNKKVWDGCFNANHNRYYYKIFLKNVHINNINMLYHDGIKVSKGIAVIKTSASKERIVIHYWYFLDKGFKLQLDVCNGCHDVLMMSMGLKDIAI